MSTTTSTSVLDWLRLALTAGVGPRIAQQLVDRYGAPATIFERSQEDLEGDGVPSRLAAALVDPTNLIEARRELDRACKLGVTLLGFDADAYSPLLREIADPPPLLGVRGALIDVGTRTVAIVGSRQAGKRDARIAFEFARELAGAGVVVVSGLARGIDRAAHEGALSVPGGTTVAVLGCGLSRVYPAAHAGLAARIRERGALVSELPVDAPPHASHFPRRNRILSGLSRGTVVMAAHEKSGALITARLALEQDRSVFAIPGSLLDPLARGGNELIKKSAAALVEGAHDVLLELGFVKPEPGEEPRPRVIQLAARPSLGGVAGAIEGLLREAGSKTFDELMLETRSDVRAVATALSTLEIQRRIRRTLDGTYAYAE